MQSSSSSLKKTQCPASLPEGSLPPDALPGLVLWSPNWPGALILPWGKHRDGGDRTTLGAAAREKRQDWFRGAPAGLLPALSPSCCPAEHINICSSAHLKLDYLLTSCLWINSPAGCLSPSPLRPRLARCPGNLP